MKKWTVEDVRKAIHHLRDNHNENGTYVFKFCIDDFSRIWALVIAWQDGYIDEKDDNPYHNGDQRIAMKVAWKPQNAIMDEYGIDWVMPYNQDTGEVDDVELSIEGDDFEDDIYWMLNRYEDFKANYFDKEMEY